MDKPELLAPGGSFLSAYYAIEAGADGVYLGLTEFSARKAAMNFTFEQLRRIRGLAADRGRKIYVTVNTVVEESERERLAEDLFRMETLSVDGIIVQDMGTLAVLRAYFPAMTVHASTQMAVHNGSGIGELERLGVGRVILPREMPLTRIRELHAAHSGIELETFVHGAMCYSFSGICLASSALTGRSGNRGDCAQICRSLFAFLEGKKKPGHFFSCRDLFLGGRVRDLIEAGVGAFKIEGRMKSPEYVFNTVRLYRGLIDAGIEMPAEEYAELVRRAELTFCREKTTGFLDSESGEALVDHGYPGHRGSPVGTVAAVRDGGVSITLRSVLSLHDGLSYFPDGAGEPFIFSVRRIGKGGRDVRFARAGDTVHVDVPHPPAGMLPRKGQEIFQLSSRFLDLAEIKESSVPPLKVPIDVSISLAPDGEGHVLSARPAGGMGKEPPFRMDMTVARADRSRQFLSILQPLFSESGESLFVARRLTLENGSGLPSDGIFVPPSQLKKAKNAFYRHLDVLYESAMGERVREASAETAGGEARSDLPPLDAAAVSRRGSISPVGQEPIPFAGLDAEGSLPEGVSLAILGGFTYVPLPPVIMDDAAFLKGLERLVSGSPGTRFAVGLSNVAHLAFADRLRNSPNAWFFVDFPLYVANLRAYRFFENRVKRLLFQYFWMEGDQEGYRLLASRVGDNARLVRMAPNFRAPLFYSLGCFAKHSLFGGTCASECPKDFHARLEQGKNGFVVVVRDCVTYLFRE